MNDFNNYTCIKTNSKWKNRKLSFSKLTIKALITWLKPLNFPLVIFFQGIMNTTWEKMIWVVSVDILYVLNNRFPYPHHCLGWNPADQYMWLVMDCFHLLMILQSLIFAKASSFFPVPAIFSISKSNCWLQEICKLLINMSKYFIPLELQEKSLLWQDVKLMIFFISTYL